MQITNHQNNFCTKKKEMPQITSLLFSSLLCLASINSLFFTAFTFSLSNIHRFPPQFDSSFSLRVTQSAFLRPLCVVCVPISSLSLSEFLHSISRPFFGFRDSELIRATRASAHCNNGGKR